MNKRISCLNTRPMPKVKKEPVETAGKVLDYSIEHQQQTAWCWAANTATISKYYDPASKWTQCALANEQLKQKDCCTEGNSNGCNQSWYLNRALEMTGNLAGFKNEKASWSCLKCQIDDGLPFSIFLHFGENGGHFVSIYGFNDMEHIYIGDPWYGNSVHQYSVFPATYHNLKASWTWSYYTKHGVKS